MRSLLLGLVVAALMAFLAALSLQGAPAPVWRHVLFAMGVMPLILGAMLYFIPVLTRTSSARGAVLLVPVAGFLAGCVAVIAFKGAAELLPFIAVLAFVPILVEAIWIWRRRAQVFGVAHPGVDWYMAALAALMLALIVIGSRLVWPEGWGATRLLHLHLNLLGFLGLTAIGTLRVLLPTVLASQDTAAMRYLRRQLPIAVAGTLGVAAGAAFWPPLATLGALFWLWSGLSLLAPLWRNRRAWLTLHNASIALVAAVLGWVLVLCAGMAHGSGWMRADTALSWLLYLFLLPLVTGATSYLLPVWRWPGRRSPAHERMRAYLMAYSGVRVLAFWISAILTLANAGAAPLPAMLALVGYLLQMSFAFIRIKAEPVI